MTQEFLGYFEILDDYEGLKIVMVDVEGKDSQTLWWGAKSKKECQSLITVLNWLGYYSDKFLANL